MNFYDAHNHLQDERFEGRQSALIADCVRVGVRRMVVNGSCAGDWSRVLALARQHPQVIPSFGYHPWYVGERTSDWTSDLARFLDAVPSGVGEIGLDRWKRGLAYSSQEAVFADQLRVAAERNRPASIHCLQAWGRLESLLESNPRPACGFLLHSYGGPLERVASLARLGAYFSFPGYFARPGKERQRQAFRAVPPERLLIETDAPDQCLPDELTQFPLRAGSAEETAIPPGESSVETLSVPPRRLNHPANLAAVYEYAARMLGDPVETLAARVEENFHRLFRGL